MVRALFEQVTDAIVVSEPDGAIVDANAPALQLFGYAHGELMGQAIDRVLPERLRARRKDGSELDVEVVSREVDGVVVSFVRDASRYLSAALAHDFNNVLAVILARCELLAGDDAAAIRTAAETGRSLVRQLLAFGRRPTGTPQLVAVTPAIERFARMLRLGDRIELLLDLAADGGAVRIDEVQLQQVLLNLALNARDAMLDGGRLTLSTRRHRDRVEVIVTDTGIGITDEQRARIFEPFYTTKDRGTGLGLATVADIVRQAGGTIEVTSAPGQGATFRLSFPRAEAAGTLSPPLREPLEEGGEKVLLVDDDELVLRALEAMLARSGYQVIAKRSGDDAIAAARDQPIDALVTDIIMPRTSGFAIAEALRALHPTAKVLYLSGYGDLPAERIGDGASFLAKPFSAAELLRELRTLLDRA